MRHSQGRGAAPALLVLILQRHQPGQSHREPRVGSSADGAQQPCLGFKECPVYTAEQPAHFLKCLNHSNEFKVHVQFYQSKLQPTVYLVSGLSADKDLAEVYIICH